MTEPNNRYDRAYTENFENFKWLVDNGCWDFVDRCKKEGTAGELILQINKIGKFTSRIRTQK